MTYIEGFVAAVPVANREKYLKHAADTAMAVAAWISAVAGSPMPPGSRSRYPVDRCSCSGAASRT